MFLAKMVFKGSGDELQGWCAEVLEALPGNTVKMTDKSKYSKLFLQSLRSLFDTRTQPKTYCEVLDDGTPAFHLRDSPDATNDRAACVALLVCALHRHSKVLLDDSIRVFYGAEDTIKRIARGRVEHKVLVYGIGYPGSGKSSAFKSALADMHYKETLRPVPLVVYDNGFLLLGQWRDGMNPGTDAMEHAVKPKVLDWMRECQPGFIIAEGIRLCNRGFFDAAKSLGYSVQIVCFDVTTEVSQSRYTERGAAHGAVWNINKQNFFKGACTQIDNMKDLVTKFIDGTQERSEVAAD